MSDAYGFGVDPDDEQATAEALDDDRYDGDEAHYPPDHALASLEATAPIDTGDVPLDTLRERLWREEPDELPPADDSIELVEPHPDAGLDPDFAGEAQPPFLHDVPDDGALLGEPVEPDEVMPAEEAAIHVIDPPA